MRLLEGIRVVECAVLFNGDQTGRLLGDLGATVIKVESPGVGDYLREFLGQITPHHSPAHLYVNRNKRSMTLDLRSEAGRRILFELIATADIFVDGFAGDACTKLGIGYEHQRAVKPDIIYAQCSGFGAHGPYSSIPTHGQMMGALGGGMLLETGPDGLVAEVGGMGDGTVVAATNTALTAVAALIQRDRTGEGAYIDGSGADSVLATQWFHPTYAWNDSRLTSRRGMPGSQHSAKYKFYESKDGRYVLFCGIEEKFWSNFCRAIDRSDLLDAHDDSAPVDFGATNAALAQVLAEVFRSRTQAEWTQLAIDADIALGPAHRVEDLADDPHLAARGIVHHQVHPQAGPFTSVAWPAPVADQPFEVRLPAPGLGEHTEVILAELGYSSGDIAALRTDGVV